MLCLLALIEMQAPRMECLSRSATVQHELVALSFTATSHAPLSRKNLHVEKATAAEGHDRSMLNAGATGSATVCATKKNRVVTSSHLRWDSNPRSMH